MCNMKEEKFKDRDLTAKTRYFIARTAKFDVHNNMYDLLRLITRLRQKKNPNYNA